MAETSGIAWTRSTFNAWIGCTKVGPGCDHCYAEAFDNRVQFGGAKHWGPGVPRLKTRPQYWAQPLRWNKLAAIERETGRVSAQSKGWHTPGFWPVFCSSLADVFDNEVPQEWRADLFDLIEQTPNLSWLLVTKRIGNVRGMIPTEWNVDSLHPERRGWPQNVRLLITVVNQEEADRDIPKLLALPCKNGVSYEPALGAVDWSPWLAPVYRGDGFRAGKSALSPALQWLIVGGESSQGQHKARPFNIDWARSMVQQCKAAGVPAFVKQLGSAPFEVYANLDLRERAGADPDEWPEDLRVREFPR